MSWSGHHVLLVGHCKNLAVSWSGHHVALFGQCDSLAVSWSGHHVALIGQSGSSLLCLGVVITLKLVNVKALRLVKPAKI